MSKQTFNFSIEAKETVWNVYPVEVIADTEEEAKQILRKHLSECVELSDAESDVVHIHWYGAEVVDGSHEYMTPQENNGMPTIVVSYDETCEEIYNNELISLEERE
jgi:hypothetical protein